jgi:DNA-directed RNA polymerase
MQSKEIRIAPFDYIKHTFQVKVPVKEKLDLLKQNRAFMPNLIHSLDATTLVFLIEAYFNKNPNPVTNFYAIHDCFGTTCNNMQYIISMLQSIYISLYSDKKYLLEIDNYMRYYVKDKIDNNFDIKSVGGKVEISTVNRKNEEKIIKRTFPNINNIINNKFDLSTYLKNSFYIIN